MAQHGSGREVKLLVQAGINLDSVDAVSTKTPSLVAFVEQERILGEKFTMAMACPLKTTNLLDSLLAVSDDNALHNRYCIHTPICTV